MRAEGRAMNVRNVILVLAVVGTASADVCRVGDIECLERKAECYAATVTDPTDPRLCTA